MSEARLILTCGLPGAGKATLAKQLAGDRSAVRLTKDDWLWALGLTPWATTTQAKVNHELWQLAQEIVSLGLSVVLDFGFAARIERDEVRSVARGFGVGVELQFLDVPVDDSGGVSRPGARTHLGTVHPSAAPTLTNGRASSRPPMLPSLRCSTRRQTPGCCDRPCPPTAKGLTARVARSAHVLSVV